MPTYEEAVEVLKMFYRKPVEGLLPIDATWDIYIDLAKATGKTSVTDRTITTRKNNVDRLIKWLKKYRPTVTTIEGVTGPIAAAFATHLATTNGRDGKPLKTKSRINIISDLTTVWNMLTNASTQIRNPWHTLRPTDVDGEIGKPFTREDEERVLSAAERVGKNWPEVCTIMRHTGLRYGDVALMQWNEIQGDVIRLDPNKTKRHRITVSIPIIEPVRRVIDTIQRTGDYLFPLHAELYGDRGRAARKTLNFKEVLTAAGLADAGYTVHSWRHTAATRLGETGANIETRKALLGHNVDATAERYDHADHLGEKRAALERAANANESRPSGTTQD